MTAMPHDKEHMNPLDADSAGRATAQAAVGPAFLRGCKLLLQLTWRAAAGQAAARRMVDPSISLPPTPYAAACRCTSS